MRCEHLNVRSLSEPLNNEIELVDRIVSPRIHAKLFDLKVDVLLDSGSLTIFVAVGKKTTVIKKQIRLTLKIGTLSISYPFLVDPGLSTDVLTGIDWIFENKGIVDCYNKKIHLLGQELTNDDVTFKTNIESNLRALKLVKANEGYWYSFSETMNKAKLMIVREIQHVAHSIINVMLGTVNRVFNNDALGDVKNSNGRNCEYDSFSGHK